MDMAPPIVPQLTPNTPLMTTPTGTIMEHHVEVSQPEGSIMVMVKELLEDSHFQPSMM